MSEQKRKCKIIALDGAHGTGKDTVINYLKEYYTKKGVKVYTYSELEGSTTLLPRKIFGRKNDLNQQFWWLFNIYARNHYVIKQHYDEDCLVILNRDYIGVYAYSKVLLQEKFADFLKATNVLSPITDLVIVLTCPSGEAIRRITSRNRENSKANNEFDRKYFEDVNATILSIAKSPKYIKKYRVVDTTKKNYKAEIRKIVNEVISDE